jgi:hypothetical protein
MDVFWTVYNFKGRVNPYFTYQPISQTQVAPIILPPPLVETRCIRISYTHIEDIGEKRREWKREMYAAYIFSVKLKITKNLVIG